MRRIGCWTVIALPFVLWIAAKLIYRGGETVHAGMPTLHALPEEVVNDRLLRQKKVSDEPDQVLFGDLHVHTTFSADAFMWSVPMMGGDGVHPPADACDFARYCSQLDFYALTDHAESIAPRMWTESKESVRECNTIAQGSKVPDLFAFTGFEWTQVGLTPEEHYGHKNVIYPTTDDEHLPTRPIAAPGITQKAFNDPEALWKMVTIPIRDFSNRKRYLDVYEFIKENGAVMACPSGVDVRAMPDFCRESAADPEELFKKLNQWGFEALVIPHGTTWGLYTPRGYTWDKQLAPKQDDPERQRLVEIFSGHGNAEEYREHDAVRFENGHPVCPPPHNGYEPCCWRAGEIIRSRCRIASKKVCEERVQKARDNFLRAGAAGPYTVPGATVEEWGNCEQCTDCFQPAYNSRPGGSVQYMLARGYFSEGEQPRHTTLGFVGSSDNHSARPGTGYKELERKKMTEARGASGETWQEAMNEGAFMQKRNESVAYTVEDFQRLPPVSLMLSYMERQASFFLTGGLVAVHAKERTREALWQALKDRNVYGTSGDRILLWFDLLRGEDASPMGTSTAFSGVPRFRVRAAGSFEQQDGCPDYVKDLLGADEVNRVCAGQCYYPSEKRRKITRIEVVRIRRQMNESESIESLIDDPWLKFPCPPDKDLCDVSFEDPDFTNADRENIYYVRAIQETTLAVNAGGLRCQGETCKPCYGSSKTPDSDSCLSPTEERAWSSPIYLQPQTHGRGKSK